MDSFSWLTVCSGALDVDAGAVAVFNRKSVLCLLFFSFSKYLEIKKKKKNVANPKSKKSKHKESQENQIRLGGDKTQQN